MSAGAGSIWLPSRRVIWIALAAATIGATLYFAVFPIRTYVGQRSDRADRGAQLELIEAEVADLQARVDALGTDEEIERLAREQYHLVFPDEEAYTVLPPPESAGTSGSR